MRGWSGGVVRVVNGWSGERVEWWSGERVEWWSDERV